MQQGQIYGVIATGGGTFTQNASNITLAVNQPVVISGYNLGSASIPGYSNTAQLFYVAPVPAPSSTGFTLSANKGGIGFSGNAGTITGLTFTYFPLTTQSTISVSDYNALQNVVNGVLGANLGGYGQAVTSSQKISGTQVSATEWTALRTDVYSCRNHQDAVVPNLIPRSKGDKISINEVAEYASSLVSVYQNRYQFNSGNSALKFLTSTNQIGNTWGKNGVNESLEFTYTVTFASALDRAYFFNAGGYITFTASNSGSWVTTTKDYSWQSALNKLGEIRVGYLNNYQANGTQPGTSTGLGFKNLTTTQQLLFTFASTTYTPNDIKLYGATSGTSNLIFKYVLEDQSISANQTIFGGQGPFGVDELVQGTITSTAQCLYASGIGQVTTAAPSASVVASILPNLGP
jgi:hypothetical protein